MNEAAIVRVCVRMGSQQRERTALEGESGAQWVVKVETSASACVGAGAEVKRRGGRKKPPRHWARPQTRCAVGLRWLLVDESPRVHRKTDRQGEPEGPKGGRREAIIDFLRRLNPVGLVEAFFEG